MFKKANMPVSVAAKALGVDAQTVRVLCQQNLVDWGTAYKHPQLSNQPFEILSSHGFFMGGRR